LPGSIIQIEQEGLRNFNTRARTHELYSLVCAVVT